MQVHGDYNWFGPDNDIALLRNSFNIFSYASWQKSTDKDSIRIFWTGFFTYISHWLFYYVYKSDKVIYWNLWDFLSQPNWTSLYRQLNFRLRPGIGSRLAFSACYLASKIILRSLPNNFGQEIHFLQTY